MLAAQCRSHRPITDFVIALGGGGIVPEMLVKDFVRAVHNLTSLEALLLCVGFCDPLAAWPPVHPRSAAREGVRLAPLALYGDATGRTLGGAGVQAACTLEGCGHSQKVADR